MLKDFGCEVITGLNGTDALTALVNDQRIDILISDVNMPGLWVTGLPRKRNVSEIQGDSSLGESGQSRPSHDPKPFLQDELERVMRRTTGLC